MRIMRHGIVVAMAMVVYCLSFTAALAKDDAAKTGTAPKTARDDAVKISAASKVIREIAATPKRRIPPELLKGASAIVIIPKTAKRNFMVSGGSAGGLLLVQDKEGAWSNPVFITLTGGTLGWQMVGDPMDIVLVLKSKKSVDAILKGKFTLDTKVAIEPGHLGSGIKSPSSKEQKVEISSYVRSHGAFEEEAVVAGTTLHIDSAANDHFYAKAKVTPDEIVSGKVLKSTEDVKTLQKLLADYAAAK
ncbi:MAG: lipid-binding SYLF domain-containing protein [Desulfuromonadales bacterium]|nr:lipid-binding SYLF domain-containing protein [Desulfuromonadales bacterium]